jgi:hypothetical protein
MYLVDTNVWLERLLDQAKSGEVGRFLGRVSSDRLFMTDFAFHTIGVVMSRLDRADALLRFVQDVFVDGAVGLIRLEPEEVEQIVLAKKQFNLDFDDAYQYVAAEKHGLTVVSFDMDFERTDRGRKLPSDIATD